MSDVSADARREHRRGQQRTLRVATGLVLLGLTLGTLLGRHLRWSDLFFVGAFLALQAYYSEWAFKRSRWRVVLLITGGVCVVAILVLDFA